MPATSEALIQKAPGVMGGEACIRRTRIAVWILVNMKRHGATDEQLLLEDYRDQLTQDDLDAAWTYDAAHREEIDAAIRRNEEAE